MSKLLMILGLSLLASTQAMAAGEYGCDFSKPQDAPRSSRWPEGAIEKRLEAKGRSNTHVLSLTFVSNGATASTVEATICNGDQQDITTEKFTLKKSISTVSGGNQVVYNARAVETLSDAQRTARAN